MQQGSQWLTMGCSTWPKWCCTGVCGVARSCAPGTTDVCVVHVMMRIVYRSLWVTKMVKDRLECVLNACRDTRISYTCTLQRACSAQRCNSDFSNTASVAKTNKYTVVSTPTLLLHAFWLCAPVTMVIWIPSTRAGDQWASWCCSVSHDIFATHHGNKVLYT